MFIGDKYKHLHIFTFIYLLYSYININLSMGERLRWWVKFKIRKLSCGTEQDPTFPCLSFSLPSPVIRFYSRQTLWDANALIIPKPFASTTSYRQKQNIYKELHLAMLNTGALSSGAYVYDP